MVGALTIPSRLSEATPFHLFLFDRLKQGPEVPLPKALGQNGFKRGRMGLTFDQFKKERGLLKDGLCKGL